VLVSNNNQVLSRLSLTKRFEPAAIPAIFVKDSFRLDLGMTSESFRVSPSLAPVSSRKSFGIITAIELPNYLILASKIMDTELFIITL